MESYVINGGKPLNGIVTISGSKNAALPIITATIIEPGQYILENMPTLRDTLTMTKMINIVGGEAKLEDGVMYIDTRNCDKPIAPYELVKTMRASFYVLGPFMSRFNKAVVSLPGGCAWGPRPVDYHLTALEQMGAKVNLESGNIVVEGKLHGSEIIFKQSSVGATGNILMAATKAFGETIIKDYAKEPEIEDLINFLRKLGSNIQIQDNDVRIIGEKELYVGDAFTYQIIPDRIEAATFMIATCICGGEILLKNVIPSHLKVVIDSLRTVGAKIDISKNEILIKSDRKVKAIDIETMPYPGFPTDIQAQWMSLMTFSNGKSTITENIYKDRFSHISELTRFGAKITLQKNVATINGHSKLKPAPVMSPDIRASAALIIAALGIEGKSNISRIYHLDRGYEDFEKKMSMLGADIIRENN